MQAIQLFVAYKQYSLWHAGNTSVCSTQTAQFVACTVVCSIQAPQLLGACGQHPPIRGLSARTDGLLCGKDWRQFGQVALDLCVAYKQYSCLQCSIQAVQLFATCRQFSGLWRANSAAVGIIQAVQLFVTGRQFSGLWRADCAAVGIVLAVQLFMACRRYS